MKNNALFRDGLLRRSAFCRLPASHEAVERAFKSGHALPKINDTLTQGADFLSQHVHHRQFKPTMATPIPSMVGSSVVMFP